MSVATFDEIDPFEAALMHYGTPRKSGRYPWGSGETPYQRYKTFLSEVDKLKKEGLTEAEIAKAFGLKSSTEIRAMRSIARNQVRESDIQQALRYKDKGMSNVAIGERMGIPESSVRSLLNPMLRERNDVLVGTANILKDRIGEDGVIDIGAGVENHLGISETKKKVAVAMLKDEGYNVYWVPNEQLGTGKITNTMVLAAPGVTFPEVMEKKRNNQIELPFVYSEDGGRSYKAIEPPKSVDSKRIAVRYKEEGGAEKDGVIELRRGVDDISLGNSNYAQVRISVDGTHYLKGMAMYSDKMPDGVDIVFNTNKGKSDNKLDAMKELRDDADLPFGSIVRQKTYIDKNGKEQLSPINIVGSTKYSDDGTDISYSGEEGNWNTWAKTLSSQMLSKQSPVLAKQQLTLSHEIKKNELEAIRGLSNPAVKKKLLEEFADGADSSAVHLKAVGLPRTRAQVILPINSLKDTEVYAPNYNNGEKVVLIRHPHGGIFEIPELTVNNRNREANSLIKSAQDAVGINSNVANRLSGADFDGDTVLVIPNNSKSIKTSPPLAALKNFDPQQYKIPEGSNIPPMTGKQKHMGDISNLITDMSIQGAPHSEIARAVKHSMVVIDAEKHNLNYKLSAQENGIAELKKRYQGDVRGGASTLISLSKSQERVGQRKPRAAKDGGPIDPNTGEKMWEYTGETYTETKVNKRTGAVTEKVIPRTMRSTKMAEAKDAHSLSSGTTMEAVYADYANGLKALANQARKEALAIKPQPISKSAKEVYANELNSLKAKLNVAQKNAPIERQAQLAAKAALNLKTQANPNWSSDEIKKARANELEKARARLGAKKERVTFTPREWEAVQAGAVSTNILTTLLKNADMDQVKQLATPRDKPTMSAAMISRAKSMAARGYTQAEIANALGVSVTTINKSL